MATECSAKAGVVEADEDDAAVDRRAAARVPVEASAGEGRGSRSRGGVRGRRPRDRPLGDPADGGDSGRSRPGASPRIRRTAPSWTSWARCAIDIAYGGSCTAGKEVDLDLYARVMSEALAAGRRVKDGVDFFIQFGSQSVEEYARDRGYLDVFEKTGVRVIHPGCGACIGCGPGRLELGPSRSRSPPSTATTRTARAPGSSTWPRRSPWRPPRWRGRSWPTGRGCSAPEGRRAGRRRASWTARRSVQPAGRGDAELEPGCRGPSGPSRPAATTTRLRGSGGHVDLGEDDPGRAPVGRPAVERARWRRGRRARCRRSARSRCPRCRGRRWPMRGQPAEDDGARRRARRRGRRRCPRGTGVPAQGARAGARRGHAVLAGWTVWKMKISPLAPVSMRS